MIRTNKTILRAVSISAALIVCAGVAFAQEAAPKFIRFDQSTYKGKTGKVTMPYAAGDSSLVLRKVVKGKLGDYLQVTSKSQSVRVPVGSYKLAYYSMVVADQDENKWSLTGSPTSEAKAPAMEVTPNGQIKIATCEPLVASIKVTQAGDKVNMSFQMIASNGDKVTLMKMAQGGEAPSFKVLSESGEVLMSGKFEFGWGGSCSYSGGIPENVKGTVTVTPVVNAGPFKVKTEDTAWTRQ